ncbi:hypothetical protein [Dactylosporangium sp. NPDC051541]|uniref:hypothetical protein n=1 Tax=Dactylosporangium sp. NPDC051541 TaxID=3363977 RepID=UPI0037B8B817
MELFRHTFCIGVGTKFCDRSDGRADHGPAWALLIAAAPNGHELDGPWSTCIQDAAICADAGLASASVDDQTDSSWIYHALEPLLNDFEGRDEDFIDQHGPEAWRIAVVREPAMASALAFVRELIDGAVQADTGASRAQFDALVPRASILLPPSAS